MVIAAGVALLALGATFRFGIASTGLLNGPASAAMFIGGILLIFGCAYCLPRWAQKRQEAQLAEQDHIEPTEHIFIDLSDGANAGAMRPETPAQRSA